MTEIENIDAAGLSLVSTLAREMSESAKEVSAIEAKLKAAQAKFANIEQVRLPEAMNDIGLKELKLQTGETITVKPTYHAGITAANRAKAMAWLKENDFGDLIKNFVIVEFGKGAESAADELTAQLRKQFPALPVDNDESIHASTLKALVKTQYESGDPLPEDLFGVHIINKATIKAGDK
jgi:hypothetical protein